MGIDSIVRERHLLKHPFYRRWQAGKVPVEVLKEYAKQYYHYEKSLPSFLESTLSHMPEGPARSAVEEVLSDESGNPKPHSELWMDFAKGLGLSEDEVKNSRALPRTMNLVGTYGALSARGAEEGLGAFYAYESQFPEVAQTKADGLREFYDVNDKESLLFFDLHATLDVEHAKAIRSALVESERSREAAHLALEAWWGMLDQFEAMSAAA